MYGFAGRAARDYILLSNISSTNCSRNLSNYTMNALFLSLFLNLVMASQDFSGSYRLISGHDSTNNPIDLPHGDFLLQIKETNEAETYKFYLKVGNSLSSTFTVESDTNSVKFNPLLSTRMMPPQPLAELETQLSKMIPAMNKIQLDDNSQLTFEGNHGSLQFLGKVASS